MRQGVEMKEEEEKKSSHLFSLIFLFCPESFLRVWSRSRRRTDNEMRWNQRKSSLLQEGVLQSLFCPTFPLEISYFWLFFLLLLLLFPFYDYISILLSCIVAFEKCQPKPISFLSSFSTPSPSFGFACSLCCQQ